MKDVYIYGFTRTAIGRYNGGLKDVRPDDLAAHVVAELVQSTKIDGAYLEDVILGCANQAGEDNRNVARMAVLLAGLPETVSGSTVNRLCASSMDAVGTAYRAVALGEGELYIAGGVESMTRAPFVMGKPTEGYARGDLKMFDSTLGWRFINDKLAKMHHPYSMGETAENVAEKYGISRQRQDDFALQSQHKYGQAEQAGRFKEEICPFIIPQKKGEPKRFDKDEHPRPDTKIEDLVKLRPAFREGGTVTAGNSSGINDGAAALLIGSKESGEKFGLKPLVKILGTSSAGVDPAYMGVGPVPATQKLLKRLSKTVSDIDLFELNEAFAAQVLACVDELKIDQSKLNVNGGAIALGHPLGMSGARIVGSLAIEMHKRGSSLGLATMCIGVGQGMACLLAAADS